MGYSFIDAICSEHVLIGEGQNQQCCVIQSVWGDTNPEKDGHVCLYPKQQILLTISTSFGVDLNRIKKGILNPKKAVKYVTNRAGRQLLQNRFDNSGLHILEQDWDTLVIFDCARYDLFSDTIDLSGELSAGQSLASVTGNVVERNFDWKQAHDVVYLSANPAVGSREECLDVFKFVGIWNESSREKQGQENTRGLTDPEPVIEKSQELHNQYPNKRHIVHLLPPHVPHIFKEGEQLNEDSPYRNYDAVREGAVSTQEMREVYAENLQYVIEQTTEFLQDIEGKVVLTGDHGELLGEKMPFWMKIAHSRWGNQWHKYDWGHYSDVDMTELREIPWFEFPVERRREIETENPIANEYDMQSIENKLEALGYRT